jgi:hypothetical protein
MKRRVALLLSLVVEIGIANGIVASSLLEIVHPSASHKSSEAGSHSYKFAPLWL